LSTVSAVASQYFLIRQLDEQIQKQQQAQENNIKLLNIYEAQLKEGLVAESEVLNQKAEIASLTQQLEDLRRQRQVTTLQLATLLGIPAGDLVVPEAPLTNTVKEIDVPPGLPSDLLKRRPDIIAQEFRVLSAHELVGQAKLARLPSISLTGSANAAGGASAALSALVKTWTFGIGPSINIPVFDPNTKVNIKINEAQAKQAVEQYRKTVITAFEEVEIALTNLASRKKQEAVLEEQIEHLEVVRDVQYAQLKEGLVSQLQVFDTDRQLLAAQLAKLQTHQQILSDTVTLYNALGGGWSMENVDEAEL
jgi:NodT family efflux transporter outer membrane factor (OMF) lipoprotein